MLTRRLVAAGVAALLGGCAGAPSSGLPPVRDGPLPRAAVPEPAPALARIDRSAPQTESAFGHSSISRPRPVEAPSKETLNGNPMAAIPGESLAEPELPEEDTTREGNIAVVALLESAREAEKTRQYGRAAAALERALKVEPRNPRLWHRLATVRYRQGRHPEAEALARRSMSLSPEDAKLDSRNWRVIAAARHGHGDAEGAREALRRARSP